MIYYNAHADTYFVCSYYWWNENFRVKIRIEFLTLHQVTMENDEKGLPPDYVASSATTREQRVLLANNINRK